MWKSEGIIGYSGIHGNVASFYGEEWLFHDTPVLLNSFLLGRTTSSESVNRGPQNRCHDDPPPNTEQPITAPIPNAFRCLFFISNFQGAVLLKMSTTLFFATILCLNGNMDYHSPLRAFKSLHALQRSERNLHALLSLR
jgi:hypothetical protein